MNCDKAQEQLAALVYGESIGEEHATLQIHVDSCDTCRRQLEDMRNAAETLQQALGQLPDLKLDDDRRNTVLTGPPSQQNTPKRKPRIFRIMLQAAAVIAIILVAGISFVVAQKNKYSFKTGADHAMAMQEAAPSDAKSKTAKQSARPGSID